MSIFSTNRFKNLSAEYVEESLKLVAEEAEKKEEVEEVKEDPKTEEVKEEAEVKNNTESEDDAEEVNEAAYIDSLLESLNEED